MKLITLAAAAAALLTAGVAHAGTLEVTLTGVQAKGGHILAGLQTRDQFMKPAGVTGTMLSGDSTGAVTFTLEAPAGDYALAILHDADDNQTMTMAGAGPAEGWGYVGGDKLRAKPTFDQVSTRIPAGSGVTRITIPMIYPAG